MVILFPPWGLKHPYLRRRLQPPFSLRGIKLLGRRNKRR